MKARQKWDLLMLNNKGYGNFRMLKCRNLGNSTDYNCEKSY
jgi:hypothetical protein